MKKLRGLHFTWLLLAAGLLFRGGGVYAQESVDTWIHRLEDDATRDQARDQLREQELECTQRRRLQAFEKTVLAITHDDKADTDTKE